MRLHLLEVFAFRRDLFRSSEVAQFRIPFHVNDKVVRLEISIYDTQVIKLLKNEHDASNVELAVLSGQKTNLPYHIIQVLASDELNQRVQVPAVLEGHIEFHDERGIDVFKQGFLLHYVFLHEELLDLLFVVALHSVDPLVVSMLHEKDRPKYPLPQLFDEGELL